MQMFCRQISYGALCCAISCLLALGALAGCSSGGSSASEDLSLGRDACGVLEGRNARVVNGTPCDPEGFPVVELRIVDTDGGVSLCSGSIVSARAVLTAGHCFLSTPRSVFIVSGSQSIAAESVAIHPQFEFRLTERVIKNDLAIVHSSRVLGITPLPILLSQSPDVGDIVSIFGYGFTEEGVLGELHSGQMRISRVSEDHIYAAFDARGSNSCNGDSGGPAVLTHTGEDGFQRQGIVGVVSTGSVASCGRGDTTVFSVTYSQDALDFFSREVPELEFR